MRRSSEETKAKILAAARDRFAADGYERATIRVIAADAQIDPSMVMRYFGNKEKLFAAAAHIDLALPMLGDVSRDEIGEKLVRHFLDRWEGDEALMVLLRTGVTNESAAERMRSIFTAQLMPVARSIAGGEASTDTERDGAASGDAESALEAAAVRAGLAASQILGLALCRYVLRFPPIVGMEPEEIVACVSPVVQRYLADPLPLIINDSARDHVHYR